MDKLGRRLVGLTWAVDADAEEVTEYYGAVSYVGEAGTAAGRLPAALEVRADQGFGSGRRDNVGWRDDSVAGGGV